MKLLLALALLLVVLYHVNAQGGIPVQGQGQANRVNNMNYLRELMMARMRAQQQKPQFPQKRPFMPRPRYMPFNNLMAGAYMMNNDAFEDMLDGF